jgi:hypothetical protein
LVCRSGFLRVTHQLAVITNRKDKMISLSDQTKRKL